jgi:hypothetical protein
MQPTFLGYLIQRLSLCINRDKHRVGLHLWAIFSQTHPVTLAAAEEQWMATADQSNGCSGSGSVPINKEHILESATSVASETKRFLIT